MGGKCLLYIVSLFVLIYFCVSFLQQTLCERQLRMEGKIYLVPIDKIEDKIVGALVNQIENTFNRKVEIHRSMKIPPDAYNQMRSQYLSTNILRRLRYSTKPLREEKVLGIADVDLYVKGLNFVFGEAELGGNFAIISLARLRESFYSLPENETLFLERAIKEAVHEIGHLYELRHCDRPDCVMYFSNSLRDTDRKSTSFCSKCRELLDNLQLFQ